MQKGGKILVRFGTNINANMQQKDID